MSDSDLENEYLRQRVRDFEALLELSYCLMFKPHENILKRKEHLEKYKARLAEFGIGDTNANRTLN